MNLLLNMNIRREMIAPLRERGHVCRHAGGIGMSRAKDVGIVTEAKRSGEIILTHDLDYGHLLAFGISIFHFCPGNKDSTSNQASTPSATSRLYHLRISGLSPDE